MPFTLIIFLFSSSLFATETIRVLNWWDFLSQESISKLKSEGYNVELSVYKSNDVVVSKLISEQEKFDVVIISNTVLKSLFNSGIIKKNEFKEIVQNRKYQNFIKDQLIKNDYSCLPYMWSTSLFAINSSSNSALKFNHFKNISRLRKLHYKIGIIDDKFEVLSRVIDESKSKCSNLDNFENILRCQQQNLNYKLDIHPSEFQTSIGDIVQHQNSAVYGWHGEIEGPHLNNSNNHIKLFLPKGRSNIGLDLVCFLNNKVTLKKKKSIKKFIKLLTSSLITNLNVKKTQYFSPYEDDTKYLRPIFKDIYSKLQKKTIKLKPVIISAPAPLAHDLVNKWWVNVRY